MGITIISRLEGSAEGTAWAKACLGHGAEEKRVRMWGPWNTAEDSGGGGHAQPVCQVKNFVLWPQHEGELPEGLSKVTWADLLLKSIILTAVGYER